MLRYFSLLLIAFLFAGCSVKSSPPLPSKIEKLSQTLQSIDSEIPSREADRLARDIYFKTYQLSKEFELVTPPQYHNFLVNVGLRKSGLCYHFSDALYLYLRSQNYESFDFHLVGANIGEYWSEHNALAVVSQECRSEACIMKKGIIIDAWRDSGVLYYSKIDEDKDYHWKHRSNRCEVRLHQDSYHDKIKQ